MPLQQLVQFGPYRLDGASGQLWRHTQVVKLPPKAAAVLWCLVRQAGQVVPKATLLDTVWAETAVSEGVLAVCIRDLRRTLGDDPKHPHYIETVHTRGYRFVAPVEPLQPPGSEPAGSTSQNLPAPHAPPGMVGREAEVAQVQVCLERARHGQRQVLFVTGEAGIGKTTLVDACAQEVAAHGVGWIGWGQCIESYGPGTGYLPVLEALGRLCRGPAGSTVLAQLRQWAPTWLAQISGMLPPAERARLQRRTLGATRERRLRELAEALEALTQAHLLVLVLEDLHWSDPSTVEVLTMLARRREAARLMILGTYRPVELILRAHPLKPATAELRLHGHCTELALSYLQETDVSTYVAHRFPAPVAQVVASVIYQRTAGHPLFMVHLAEYLAQQAGLAASAGEELAVRVAVVAEAVPSGVQQLIELQLGHLSAEEQDVLAMASVAGVEFAVASVAAGLQTSLDLPEAVCEALAQRGQFLEADGLAVWPDGTVSGQYRFRHAVYQQVLYRQVADTRRVQGHRRIGVRLEAGYGTQTGEIEAVLAVHFERCRDYGRALQYLLQATENATRKSTPHEVIVLATKGMELLAMLPETPAHLRQELDFQVAIGRALMATKGYANADVERVYARAWELCRRVGETPQLFPTLFGLWRFYNAKPQLHTARELAETLLNLTQQAHDPTLVLPARYALGVTEFYLGNFSLSRQHMASGMACDAPDQHAVQVLHLGQNLGVTCRAYAAWTLGLLGYSAQAQDLLHEAMVLADELPHPFSLVSVQCMATFLYQLRREVSVVYEQAEEAIALATTQGFALFTAFGMSSRGWALAMQGRVDEGLAQVHQGLSTYRATGAALGIPYFCTVLADVCAHSGHSAAGLQALAEAQTLMEQHAERWLEAEIYRLRGILLLQQSGTSQEEAEAWLQRALDVARFQQAKALELRVAMSLSRLWQQQGKRAAACALLAPLYGWFTEGFDTVELQDAQALLTALR